MKIFPISPGLSDLLSPNKSPNPLYSTGIRLVFWPEDLQALPVNYLQPYLYLKGSGWSLFKLRRENTGHSPLCIHILDCLASSAHPNNWKDYLQLYFLWIPWKSCFVKMCWSTVFLFPKTCSGPASYLPAKRILSQTYQDMSRKPNIYVLYTNSTQMTMCNNHCVWKAITVITASSS